MTAFGQLHPSDPRARLSVVSHSEEISRSFYAQLGPDGLANRTRPEWTEKIIAAVIEMLPQDGRVLDVGCGYGRIALPLAQAGYLIEGLDLSADLVEAARRAAEAEGLSIGFTAGSMRSLPYPSATFDAVICLWSAFHELLEEEEQREAISEMWRVLRPESFALIEGPLYEEPSEEDIRSGARRGPEHRIGWGLVESILNPHYAHDERSFRRICDAAGVSRFQVFEREWGGRQRLFLRLDKPRP
jgi:SAM-dependent methyltransferase